MCFLDTTELTGLFVTQCVSTMKLIKDAEDELDLEDVVLDHIKNIRSWTADMEQPKTVSEVLQARTHFELLVAQIFQALLPSLSDGRMGFDIHETSLSLIPSKKRFFVFRISNSRFEAEVASRSHEYLGYIKSLGMTLTSNSKMAEHDRKKLAMTIADLSADGEIPGYPLQSRWPQAWRRIFTSGLVERDILVQILLERWLFQLKQRDVDITLPQASGNGATSSQASAGATSSLETAAKRKRPQKNK